MGENVLFICSFWWFIGTILCPRWNDFTTFNLNHFLKESDAQIWNCCRFFFINFSSMQGSYYTYGLKNMQTPHWYLVNISQQVAPGLQNFCSHQQVNKQQAGNVCFKNWLKFYNNSKLMKWKPLTFCYLVPSIQSFSELSKVSSGLWYFAVSQLILVLCFGKKLL